MNAFSSSSTCFLGMASYPQKIQAAREEVEEVKAFSTAVTKSMDDFKRVFTQATAEREKHILKQAADLTRGLQQKIDALTKEASEVERLSSSEKHPRFLKTSVEKPPPTGARVELLAQSCQALRTSLDQLWTELNLEMKKLERSAGRTVDPSAAQRSDLLQCKYISVFQRCIPCYRQDVNACGSAEMFVWNKYALRRDSLVLTFGERPALRSTSKGTGWN